MRWTPPWVESPVALTVFDFDNTLFRSPLPPAGWKGGWWGKALSLSPPLVPAEPGPEWWNGWVVDAVHRARDSGSAVILLTGRVRSTFDKRVRDLLRQKGLKFDHVELHPGGGQSTFDWKVDAIREFADGAAGLRIYEDRAEHVDGFRRAFADLGVDVIHVTDG